MSPLFGSSDELAVKWNLPRVYELELIDEGEILCELEGADCDDRGAGLLVVTDQKVLFVSRPVLGEWTRIVSVPLADVESAEAFESHTWGRRRLGAFAISQRRKVGDWPTRHHDAASDAFAKFADLLYEDETLCDAEDDVSLGWRDGVLAVTDRRVAFSWAACYGCGDASCLCDTPRSSVSKQWTGSRCRPLPCPRATSSGRTGSSSSASSRLGRAPTRSRT